MGATEAIPGNPLLLPRSAVGPISWQSRSRPGADSRITCAFAKLMIQLRFSMGDARGTVLCVLLLLELL